MSGSLAETRVIALVIGVHRRNGGTLKELNLSLRLMDPGLGIDSLDLAEIVASLEREFGIALFDRTIPQTWGGVVRVLSEAVGGAPSAPP